MSAPPVKTYVANEADAVTTWFVDEAGDPTLFGKGSKVVEGSGSAPPLRQLMTSASLNCCSGVETAAAILAFDIPLTMRHHLSKPPKTKFGTKNLHPGQTDASYTCVACHVGGSASQVLVFSLL